MIKPITVNEALIGNALLNIKEGNIHPCLKMGFSEEQLKAINNLSLDEIMDISNSVVSFAKVEINHETFWKLLAIAQANTQQRQIIDRALLLGASIEMLHQYFGLSTSEVSARRQLLGIEEKMGRKAAASDEESTHIWEIWQRYKQRMESLDSQEGLERLCLIAEEGNMNLTVVWKLVSEWYSKHK